VGWFTAIAPVRLPAPGGDHVGTLKAVKERLRGVPAGGLGFGQLRYCNPRTAAALGRLAAPQLLFNYLGRRPEDGAEDWDEAPEADELRVAPDPNLGTPYLLEVNALCDETREGPRLRVILTYADGRVSPEAVAELAGHLVGVVGELGAAVSDADGGGSPSALTPSDLPLVELTQAQIDRVTASAPYGTETIWPLSPLQEGVYFQARYSDTPVYIVSNVFDFADPVDRGALREAFGAVMARNPVLRSGFCADDLPRPVALIASSPLVEPEVIDLTDLAPQQVSDRLAELTAADRLRTFDLAVPPLARFTVIRTTRGDRLIFSYHFLLLDGWSREQLLRELFAEYAAAKGGRRAAALPEPRASFADYLRWLAGRDRAASARLWAEALDGLAAPTVLFPEAVGTAPTLALRCEFTLTQEQTAALTHTARGCGVTLNALLSTALALVLGYETGSEDVVFGSTVAGRPTELDGIDSVIGMFLNTVPTRVRLEPGRSIADTARAVQAQRLQMMDHEYLGLGDIQQATAAANRGSGALSGSGPLFDSLFVLQNFLDDETFTDMETEHGIVGHDSVDASHYPLTWVASPGRRLWVKLEYRADVVDQDRARRLLDRLRNVLAQLCSHGNGLASVQLGLPGETDAGLERERATAHALPAVTVVDLLAERGGEAEDLTALVCGAQWLSQRELDSRINRLAGVLRGRSIGPKCIVALAIPRSIDAVVALFAVLRAGAAYLPLDLDYPDDRLAVMLADAAPVCALTTSSTAARIAALAPARPLIVLDSPDVLAECRAASPVWDGDIPDPGDPAYVIYTSGSTGTPKGVLTAHRGLTNMHLNHRQAIFAPAIAAAGGRRLRIAHTVSFSFDMSWEELLWLIEGHEVHICDEELRRDATALVDYCRRHRIDVVNVTPSYAQLLFEQGLLDPPGAGGHPPVLVLLGGEAVSAAVWNRLRDSPTSYGYNLYGPTEYTINTLGGGTDDSTTPTVGRPIWNTRAHVLDRWLRPVPDGVPGELYVTGAGLALGYLGRAALTAARFIANPFVRSGEEAKAGEARIYRTGDLVVRRADGNIDFLGRTDDQVKIRGYRVELGDIETALAAHPRVAAAAVIARPDPGAPGSHRLTGYVVDATAESDAGELSGQLRAHLKGMLPAYMVPAAIAVLAELPLTDNGKLDVRALTAAEPAGSRTSGRSPASAAEESLCRLYAEVLGTADVGVDDDFFDLGGHSLLSIRLINRIRAALGAEVSLRDVFDAPTVAELAARIQARPAPVTAAPPRLVAVPRPDRIPVSPAQERLLIVDRLGETGAAYNYPLIFRVRGALDLDALGAAIGDVVDRHESLRTVFAEHGGELHQRILPKGTLVPMCVVDCADREAGSRPSVRVAEAVRHRFDLSCEIPIRVTVVRSDTDDSTVIALLHHIACDEWSDGPLIADLNEAYRRRSADPGHIVAPLAPLPVQYADFTLWQRELLAGTGEPHGEFWRTALRGAPDELALPSDRPRPSWPSGAGGALSVELPAEVVAELRNLAAERQVSMLMVLHAAVAVLLHRLGAGDDIVVGTPVAGRDESALSEMVGFFVNTVVLRTDVSGNPSFGELLARVRTADLEAFAHQLLPFERVVEQLNPPRVAGRNPLFNAFLGYHLRADADAQMFGLPTEWQEAPICDAMFDLGFTLIEHAAGGGATIMAEYSADLFDPSSVRTLAQRLVAVLGQAGADAGLRVSAVDVLCDGEREAMLGIRNDTGHDVDLGGLAAAVSRQAGRTPDAVAVVYGDEKLTYADLDSWSDRLAGRLVAEAAHGSIVGISLPRSVELIVALVAVAKSGAAFLPLDPDYPAELLAFMVGDARPATVLDDIAAVRSLRHTDPARVPGSEVSPASWSYVLYTSGSTGRPKGVAVPHAGIVNRIAWLQHAYPLAVGDRMLVKTPISFDTSVWEVFWPLHVGATLVVARPGGHRDPAYLAEIIAAQRVNAVDFVPSMLELFLDEPRAGQCRSLHRVTVGGEALTNDLAARFAGVFESAVPLHNLYGPTEASVDVLGWTADGGPVALGAPGWNVRTYVLGPYFDPVPAGVPGELYLAGVQLADGYLHRPGLTAQRFIANPFEAGARMYRTGDLVRHRADGQLEYLGRTDDQIKLRGVRIEPGQIEVVLAAYPGVASARVVVRGDRLVAYYVRSDVVGGVPGGAPGEVPGGGAADRRDVVAESLRAHAASSLPAYMVPSACVELAAFPLTPSGKLDRGTLPAPHFRGGTGRPPVTERQRRLCAIFAEVLGVETNGIDDDFFALGGHSLLLVRLAAAIRRDFGVNVAVADLMLTPTVAEVADRLSSGVQGADRSLAPVLPLRVSGNEPPLFCVAPASDLAWQFAGLKRYLPQEIPLYGLQSPMLTGTPLPDTIGQLAADYADRVSDLAPTGPIRLLGWSFGGSVALLMARELRRRGRRVGFVGMLDARTDVSDEPQAVFDPGAVLTTLLREMGFPVDPGVRTTVEAAVSLVRSRGDSVTVLDDAGISRVVENYVAAERFTAAADYGRYDGDVFFVDATTLEMDLVGVASHGWRDHVSGELRVVALDCRHSELMDRDTLERLGPLIAAELAR
jgi:amino acid adenylation domain-containing protein/non-ribosomal peptide synthase protein (TIGR01720 family)